MMTLDPRPTIAAFSNSAEGMTAYVKESAHGFLIFFVDNDARNEGGFVKVLFDRGEAVRFAADLAGA